VLEIGIVEGQGVEGSTGGFLGRTLAVFYFLNWVLATQMCSVYENSLTYIAINYVFFKIMLNFNKNCYKICKKKR
jgi:hypothetical protein